MAYDLEEQESLDQLKAWWEKWGNVVLGTITVGCLAFAGVNGWNWYERNQGAKATAAYVQLQNAYLQGDTKNVTSISDGLMKDYSRHVFALLGAFIRAADAQKAGKFDEARTALTWVVEKSGHPEYAMTARIRLAGVALDEGKADEALSILTAVKPGEGDAVAYNDRLGDVYLALNRPDEAKKAWQTALEADRFDGAVTPYINLKLQSLPAAQ